MTPSPETPETPESPGAPDALLPTASGARVRAVLGELVRPHRELAAAGFTVLAAATGVGLVTAPALGRVVDIVADHRPASAVTPVAVLLVAVAVVQGLATAAGLSLVSRLGETVLARLRERFVERALSLPLAEVERAGTGDLTARVTGDVSLVAEAVRRALPELVRSSLAIVLTLAAMALLDWRFLLAALVALPVQVATARWYVRRATSLYARQRIETGKQQQRLLDSIGGGATVRAFRLEDDHTERVARSSGSVVDWTLRGVHLVLRFYNRLHVAEFAGLAAVLAAGFWLVRGGSVSVGTATAAALYFHNLFAPMNTVLVLLDDAQAAAAGLARLVGVADRPAAEATGRPVPAEATVSAKGVEHAYLPDRPVLHGVDLDLRAGERVALVGASGAGKTTLARIVAGVHPPTGGTVRLGGVALDELGPDATRRAVALVTQEVHVFAGPLADDLRLARPDASDADLRRALDRVGALGWAEALPEGLDTVVGEGGHRLTGAQAQQLALARLVLADPPVAVLDEATAEAGSTGARALERSAAAAVEGRTALIVAHRLTQAAAADRVLVMDGGRVVESGTHAELRDAGGRYAELWAAWSGSRTAP
ncbi:ABC transporter ATP-binding protein [Actinomadura kijaniata]|uniref:ABC transporter ATP-binding protein n=1 Tax=Actinomadura kijaniata TaxID=46161 RepID=UPI000833AFFE|nr:ABC transporter ATP-binding protein [Actinomadura kijaniata]